MARVPARVRMVRVWPMTQPDVYVELSLLEDGTVHGMVYAPFDDEGAMYREGTPGMRPLTPEIREQLIRWMWVAPMPTSIIDQAARALARAERRLREDD